MLHEALPARKYTPCADFKAGRCNDEYCVYDRDFGKTQCRDNIYKNTLCVTKDCHFAHPNESWTPEKGGAPANLTEILEALDGKSRWKKYCRDVNEARGCRWGDRCRFPHALRAIQCPQLPFETP